MRQSEFMDPGAEFTEAPVWMWNDRLSDEELLRQLDVLEKAGWKGFFITAAPGLVTPYLSSEWMEKVKLVVGEAAARGMKAWLYDENICPSGYAEGITAAQDPDFRLKALMLRLASRPDRVHESVAVFECELCDGRITRPVRIEPGGDAKPDRVYLEFCRYRAAIGDADHAGMTTVDVLNPAAAEAFLECTYEKYAASVGEWFGGAVPGVFTDEPQYAAGRRCDLPAVPWTERLPERFREMHGYDLTAHLPGLFYPLGEYRKTRVDFWSCVTQLFVEGWSRKLYEWCERHGLELTGHLMQEDTLLSQIEATGACMPHYEYFHVPGLDQLGREAPEWLRGERGIANVLTVKQASSVACQFGRRRVLCECYAVAGQDTSFEDRKWIGDWLAVLGVNLFDPSAALYSLRGNRKRCAPPVLFFQQPWWEFNGALAGYYSRLSYALSQGTPLRDVVVLHPIGSAWAAYTPLNRKSCRRIDENLEWLQKRLLMAHRDYDLADETHIEKYGRVEGDTFAVGACRYKAVVLPAGITWTSGTVGMLSRFVANGGRVVAVEPSATLVDGEASPLLAELLDKAHVVAERDSGSLLDGLAPVEQRVDIRGDGAEHVWYQLRTDGDKTILFLANTRRDRTIEADISVKAQGGCEAWDLFSGEVNAAAGRSENGRQTVHLTFPPVGSHLIVIGAAQAPAAPPVTTTRKHSRIELTGPWQVSREHPNALSLDYCRFKIGDGEWSELVPVHEAREAVLEGGYGSSYRLRYGFWSSLPVGRARELWLAVESPGSVQLTVNGQPAGYEGKGHWIDPSFKLICIRDRVVPGVNVIEVRGKAGLEMPSTPAWAGTWGPGVEACYVTGDFAVRKAGRGSFKLVEETACIMPGDLTTQGYPFYPGAMTFRQEVDIEKPGRSVFLELAGLNAALVCLSVNGKEAGQIFLKPYRADISAHLVTGRNTIHLRLVNSLRNLLGPLHHVKGELKWVFSESFLPVGKWFGTGESEWTDEYNLVPFGFEGACLVKETTKPCQ